MFSGCLQDFSRMFSVCSDGSCGPGGIWWSFQVKVWTLMTQSNSMIPSYSMIPAIRWSPAIWWSQAIRWSPVIRWSIGSMDFDNPTVIPSSPMVLFFSKGPKNQKRPILLIFNAFTLLSHVRKMSQSFGLEMQRCNFFWQISCPARPWPLDTQAATQTNILVESNQSKWTSMQSSQKILTTYPIHVPFLPLPPPRWIRSRQHFRARQRMWCLSVGIFLRWALMLIWLKFSTGFCNAAQPAVWRVLSSTELAKIKNCWY